MHVVGTLVTLVVHGSADELVQPTPTDGANEVHDSLIERCRSGDRAAWSELVEQYQRLVFSIALREGLDREAANDLTQTVFAILLRSLPKLRDDTPLASWLATVTRRHAWRVRDKARRTVLVDAPPEGPSVLPDEERSDIVEWVHQGLDRLGARCRELVVALYLSGREVQYSEVAEQLSMPIGSIGPTRARCLAQLRSALEELDGK